MEYPIKSWKLHRKELLIIADNEEIGVVGHFCLGGYKTFRRLPQDLQVKENQQTGGI
jgi:hypothetical protein